MTLAKIGILPGLSTSDEISLGVAVVLAMTLATVIWYAWEARKQAKATGDIASATLRPVLAIRAEVDNIGEGVKNPYGIRFRNIGSGPALNVRLERDPAVGDWGESVERGSLSTGDEEVSNRLTIEEVPKALTFTVKYDDVTGCTYETSLVMELTDGKLKSGRSTIIRLGDVDS